MKKKYLIWLMGVVLLIVLWIAGRWWYSSIEASPISKEEARKIVEEKYLGEIIKIEEANQQYSIDVERETGTYKVVIDMKSGNVVSLKRTNVAKEIEANPSLTDEDIKNILSKKVPGTIISLEQTKNSEQIVFEAVVKNAEKQQKVVIDGNSGEIIEVNPVESSKRLSEQEAGQIALEHVPGQVDDVDSVNINGIIFYLVEIEANDEKEVIVEINSITGEVKSVTWDDDE